MFPLILKLAPLALSAVVLLADASGCDSPSRTSEQIQNQRQEIVNRQAVESVGLPAITNFSEKRSLKTIYELRDQAISTYTYLSDMNGHIHFLCNSLGYPIPYSTQFTNPSQIVQHSDSYGGNVVIPQADPNGLYSPGNAEGTYIMCLDPVSKKTWPVYSEPRLITSPFKLHLND